MMKRLTLIALLFVVYGLCFSSAWAQYRLWYDQPAQTWTQALPIGNGVMGGMVFGIPAVEHIQLNEETIWAGQPNNVVNPNAKEALPKVRQLIFEGKYKEAQDLANAQVMPRAVDKNMGMPYQPFGDLYIAMPGHASYTDYERWLDLDNGKSVVRYTVDDVLYERDSPVRWASGHCHPSDSQREREDYVYGEYDVAARECTHQYGRQRGNAVGR